VYTSQNSLSVNRFPTRLPSIGLLGHFIPLNMLRAGLTWLKEYATLCFNAFSNKKTGREGNSPNLRQPFSMRELSILRDRL
jgi:hypothetical protein